VHYIFFSLETFGKESQDGESFQKKF